MSYISFLVLFLWALLIVFIVKRVPKGLYRICMVLVSPALCMYFSEFIYSVIYAADKSDPLNLLGMAIGYAIILFFVAGIKISLIFFQEDKEP